MIGCRCSAAAAVLTKKLMKPSLMPWVFSNCSAIALRSLTTSARLTSLNEVSMAIEFFDSISRSAMRLRMRVMATRCSGRALATRSRWPSRSPLVTRPPRPLPSTAAASMPCCSATRRPAGDRSALADAGLPADVLAAAAVGALDALAGALAGAAVVALAGCSTAGAATAPSSIRAITCWPVTVSPVWKRISLMMPATGAGTSRTTLSVSRSTRFSSRATASPTFLCQAAMVASETDSGRTGTLTSVDMAWPVAGFDGWAFGSVGSVGSVRSGSDHHSLV